MRKIALGLMVVVTLVQAAPVPTPPLPYEVDTVYYTRGEFDTETIAKSSKVIKEEELSKGIRKTTPEGWYATYLTDEGWMILSTIPDGRLRYGYFQHNSEIAIPLWRDAVVTKTCMSCHNKERVR